MSRIKHKKKQKNRKKLKVSISKILGQLFWPIMFIGTFIFDLAFLVNFKVDFEHIINLAIIVWVNFHMGTCLIQYVACFISYEKHVWNVRQYQNASQSRGGGPGCGKSSSMYNDSQLRTVTIKSNSVVSLGWGAFLNSENLEAIYVKAELVEDYKAASNWSKYAGIIQAIPEVE